MSSPIETVKEFLKPQDYTTTEPGLKRTAESVGNVVKQVGKTAAVVGVGVAGAAALSAAGPVGIIPAAAMLNVAECLPGITNTVANAFGVVKANSALNILNRGGRGQFSNAPAPEKFSLLEKLTGKKLSVVELFFRKKLDVPETGDPSQALRNIYRFASNAGAKSEDLLQQLDVLKQHFFENNPELEEAMYQNNPLNRAVDAAGKSESVSKSWKFKPEGATAEKTLAELMDEEDTEETAKKLEPLQKLNDLRLEEFIKLQKVMHKELESLKGTEKQVRVEDPSTGEESVQIQRSGGLFELSVDQVRDRLNLAQERIAVHLKKVEQKQLDAIEKAFENPAEFANLGWGPKEVQEHKEALIKEVKEQIANAKKESDDNFNRRKEALAWGYSVAAHDIRTIAYQTDPVLDAYIDGLGSTPFAVEARIGASPLDALKRLNPGLDPNNIPYQQTRSGTTYNYDPANNTVNVGWGMKTSQRDKVNDLENMIGRIYSRQVRDLTKIACAGGSVDGSKTPLEFGDIPNQTSLKFNVYAPTKKEARMLAESVVEIACLKGIPMRNLEISYTVGDESPTPLNLMTVEEAPLRRKVEKLMQERTATSSKAENELSCSDKMIAYKNATLKEFLAIDPNDPRVVAGPAVTFAAPAL